MAEILRFPVTTEAIIRLIAIDVIGRPRQSRLNRLRAIDKAAIHQAVAEGAPLAAAMALADRHIAAIKARLAELSQLEAGELAPVHRLAAGGVA